MKTLVVILYLLLLPLSFIPTHMTPVGTWYQSTFDSHYNAADSSGRVVVILAAVLFSLAWCGVAAYFIHKRIFIKNPSAYRGKPGGEIMSDQPLGFLLNLFFVILFVQWSSAFLYPVVNLQSSH